MNFFRTAALLMAAFALQGTVSATADEPAVKTEVLLSGLTNPCGVAVQPETGAVFVSDTGAGQIVKVSPDTPNQSTPVVTGFPQAKEANNKEPAYSVGPLGLLFSDKNKLIAGEGALKQGDEVVRVFELPADGKPLGFDDAKQKIPLASAAASKAKGAGIFFALSSSGSSLFVTAHGADDVQWVLRAEGKSNAPFADFKPFIQTKAETKLDALMGMARSSHGFLVLGSRADEKSSGKNSANRSNLAFYSIRNGNLLMGLPTELHNITGLAYSPKSGRLYAVDFSWDDPSHAGLYRLDAAVVDGLSGVKAVKMTALDKPCALAFASDNTLYVTVFGSIPAEPKTDKPTKPGRLIKITGDL